MKKLYLALALSLFLFCSCRKCEYCITTTSVIVSGDSISAPRITEYGREECGSDLRNIPEKTIVYVKTERNITVRKTTSSRCITE